MYGKIVSSNGIINVNKEYSITLDENVLYLNIHSKFDCILYLNNDKDGICVFANENFEIKDIPIKCFKIVKTEGFPNQLAWYGLY